MKITQLNNNLSIADAVYSQDIAAIKALGFHSVLCLRQAGEAPDHPNAEAQAEATRTAGLAWREIPVKSGDYNDQVLNQFQTALAELPQPIFIFCRTGRRAACLWAHHLAANGECDVDELVAKAGQFGFDLRDQIPLLSERAANRGRAAIIGKP